MTRALSVAPLQASHRSRVEEIVRSTRAFSEEEIGVALEVFDEAFKADIGHRTWDMGEPPMSYVPCPMSYEFVGAFLGHLLVGYACFGPTPSTDRTFDLYWIAVHPNAQRVGAGGTLMAEVERRLATRQARLLVVETSSRDDYAATRRFYTRRAYTEAAHLHDFYAPGDDRIVFTKRFDVTSTSPV